ncbi:MAG: hypothetical protein IT342_00630, partial [Candidatus Melainabacteria bacterium]|nr:hypothetical protein [Candidatus Melainabacteria bacterium]
SGVGAKITDLADGQKFDGGKIGFGEQYKDKTTDRAVLDEYNAYKMVEAERVAREREAREAYPPLSLDGQEPEFENLEPIQAETDINPLPQLDISDECEKQEGLQPILMEFSRGATIYDIARAELVDRSRSTGEAVDNDSIFRECNRIMVNSGFPDAHLEGRTNITMANLPKSWNSIRNGQVLTLYSSDEMNGITQVAR